MTARKWLTVILLLLPGLGLILGLIGSVAWIAVAQSFGFHNIAGESAFSTAFWTEVLDRKIFWRSVTYSLYIGTVSAFLSVALAYPLAIWLRKPFPGSTMIGALLKAPLQVQGLVAAFLFINIIAYHGLLNQAMQAVGLWDGPRRLQNDPNAVGVLILQVWKNMPFALLILGGAVQSIADDVLDAARDLGAGPWARFRRIIAPLSVTAMQAALVLIFIGALSDFSFQAIAGPTNQQSMAQLMVSMKGRGDWNEAAVIGVSLMLLALGGAVAMAAAARMVLRGRLW
ncbi:ABC transporter permease [Tabrizicola sp.]|uniref:ABC transporter permease n=1 Tax=Tabrizicola sp. TaxID=2005166 RepID=UPI003F371BA9